MRTSGIMRRPQLSIPCGIVVEGFRPSFGEHQFRQSRADIENFAESESVEVYTFDAIGRLLDDFDTHWIPKNLGRRSESNACANDVAVIQQRRRIVPVCHAGEVSVAPQCLDDHVGDIGRFGFGRSMYHECSHGRHKIVCSPYLSLTAIVSSEPHFGHAGPRESGTNS